MLRDTLRYAYDKPNLCFDRLFDTCRCNRWRHEYRTGIRTGLLYSICNRSEHWLAEVLRACFLGIRAAYDVGAIFDSLLRVEGALISRTLAPMLRNSRYLACPSSEEAQAVQPHPVAYLSSCKSLKNNLRLIVDAQIFICRGVARGRCNRRICGGREGLGEGGSGAQSTGERLSQRLHCARCSLDVLCCRSVSHGYQMTRCEELARRERGR
jgi:hypothetical protein